MKIISLGLGVQSTAMYYMSSMGELPRADYAIYGETGKEKKGTYYYLEFLQEWKEKNNGIPILIVTQKNLYADLLNFDNSTGQRFSSIPAFTLNEDGSKGMLRRQCTNEYKIMQVDWQIRQLYGLEKYKRMPQTEVWTGITLDEIERMRFSQEAWKTLVYPYLGYKADRTQCTKIDWGKKANRSDLESWYVLNKLPIPPKSACVFCPFQSDASWQDQKENQPEDFEDACKVDDAIRNSTAKKINNPLFLHDSCVPLREVKFNQLDIWKGNCATDCNI